MALYSKLILYLGGCLLVSSRAKRIIVAYAPNITDIRQSTQKTEFRHALLEQFKDIMFDVRLYSNASFGISDYNKLLSDTSHKF